MTDDCSCDRTAEILHRLVRVYPLQTLSAGEKRLKNGSPAAESAPVGAMRFDARGLAGRELLNALLFNQLSRLNEGEKQIMSN